MVKNADYEQGRVSTVDAVKQSRALLAPATPGDMVLVVDNPYILDEDGGYLQLTEIVYGYETFDEDTGEVTLTEPIVVAADDEDRVYAWDPIADEVATVTIAQVILDGEDGEPIDAEVSEGVADRLPLGTRPTDGEQVLLERDDDTWRVVDILGAAATLRDLSNAGHVDTDGPPSKPSTLTLSTRLGIIVATWDGLNDVGGPMESDLDYVEIHASPTPIVPVPGDEETAIDRLPRAGSAFKAGAEYGVDWYFYAIAIDKSGLASDPSDEAATSTAPLVDTDLIGEIISGAHLVDGTINAADKVIANTITTALLQALAVTTGKLAANAVTADKADIGLMTALIVRGALIETNPTAFRGVKINDDGLKAYDSSGNLTVQIDGVTGAVTLKTAAAGTRLEISGGTIKAYDASGNVGTFNLLAGRFNFDQSVGIDGILFARAGMTVSDFAILTNVQITDGLFVTTGGLVVNSGGLEVRNGGIDVFSGTLDMHGNAITAASAVTATGAGHFATVYADSVPTTGAAINAVMGASGQFLMNTSARRYKYDEQPFVIDLAAVRALAHKRFRRYDDPAYDPKHPDNGPWYYGVIADEAEDLDLTAWLIYDLDGELQSFNYPGFATAVALAVAREVGALNDRVKQLEEAA